MFCKWTIAAQYMQNETRISLMYPYAINGIALVGDASANAAGTQFILKNNDSI